jgi:hypothetical protein
MENPDSALKREFSEKEWAATAASLLGLGAPQVGSALAKMGIDPESWSAWDRHWSGELSAQLRRGERRLADLYAASCVEEMRRRGR